MIHCNLKTFIHIRQGKRPPPEKGKGKKKGKDGNEADDESEEGKIFILFDNNPKISQMVIVSGQVYCTCIDLV